MNTTSLIPILEQELAYILEYWIQNSIDEEWGGFVGEVNFYNEKIPFAEKGSVMNSRVLWAFSSAYDYTKNPEYLAVTNRAFGYFIHHFVDEKFGGVYWMLNYKGEVENPKKQIYALAFAIYGLSEFYKISQNYQAKENALQLFNSIEKYSLDRQNHGYWEAFNEDWSPIADLRLSAKDLNAQKTMNTHLHIAEAYANLYSVTENSEVLNALIYILNIIKDKFYDSEKQYYRLFFDEFWNEQIDAISYGHDIEAAWLLLWCAHQSKNQELIDFYTSISEGVTRKSLKGLDTDQALWYEFKLNENFLVKEKHWWHKTNFGLVFFINGK